ncbi:type 1 fimbrial protein [Pseudomonas sp. p50]|uniref:fimbrial protein n=1 Tax=Pseudomonas sp. p50(2008) TaxID=2816832 RepID=UPI00188C0F57|nr:fimbrial protein [Pseudomonas sp. p50(2008)]MBF4557648.1 type 1 fimbrial protein [Pseudomonas sp. p50(2008)]
MKKSLLAISLGLATGLAGTAAFAKTGNILFEGRITTSTCPIQIINPEDQQSGNHVNMGTVDARHFGAIGSELPGKGFIMRIDGTTCPIVKDDVAKVTFTGSADGSGNYFAVKPGGASGVSIALKDRTTNNLAPGAPSAEYSLIPGVINDMRFDALYRKTETSVTAGAASADIQFVVDIN